MALPDTMDGRLWLTNEHPAWLRAWQPVADVTEFEGGQGVLPVTLGGRFYAITRDLRGFEDRCVHGAPLSVGSLDDGVLKCRHGNAHTAPSLPVREHYGLIWLAPNGSVEPLPEVAEFEDPTFGCARIPVQEWNASAAQMADNFLDVGHFPFTHRNSIGDPDDRLVAPYEVLRDQWHFEVTHRHMAKSLAHSFNHEGEFETTERTVRFVGTAPHHVYLHIRYADTGTEIAICFFHQAVDAGHTRLYAFQLRNDMGPGGVSLAEVIEFQNIVASEDRWLLEMLEMKAIPIDISSELHVRADRITVELRRMLADLVALEAA